MASSLLAACIITQACYRRALQYALDFSLAHFYLAVVLEDQQDKSGALVAYEEAPKLAPAFREAHRNGAQLYEQLGGRRDAVRHYASAKWLDEIYQPKGWGYS